MENQLELMLKEFSRAKPTRSNKPTNLTQLMALERWLDKDVLRFFQLNESQTVHGFELLAIANDKRCPPHIPHIIDNMLGQDLWFAYRIVFPDQQSHIYWDTVEKLYQVSLYQAGSISRCRWDKASPTERNRKVAKLDDDYCKLHLKSKSWSMPDNQWRWNLQNEWRKARGLEPFP